MARRHIVKQAGGQMHDPPQPRIKSETGQRRQHRNNEPSTLVAALRSDIAKQTPEEEDQM
jgi:hypothetical protein